MADLLADCRALPKVELHAHLHGSIRSSTLVELLVGKGRGRHSAESMVGVALKSDRLLADCFRLFDVMHDVVDSIEVSYMKIPRTYCALNTQTHAKLLISLPYSAGCAAGHQRGNRRFCAR